MHRPAPGAVSQVMQAFEALRDERWAIMDASGTIDDIHDQVGSMLPLPPKNLWHANPIQLSAAMRYLARYINGT